MCVVELWDHGDPLDSARNDALVDLAIRAGADLVATNNVHYHVPAPAQAGHRPGRGAGPAQPGRHRRVAARRRRRPSTQRGRAGPPLRPLPGGGGAGGQLGRACAFDCSWWRRNLPPFPAPPGHTEMSWLRVLTEKGALSGTAPGPRRPGAGLAPDRPRAGHDRAAGIRRLFPDRVGHRGVLPDQRHLLPGRGSAANSAVCYALGSPTPTR